MKINLPIGTYLVHASRGPEYTVDQKIIEVLKGQYPLHILGDGSQVRHYTYGGDLAKGIRLCIEREEAFDEDFNLSTSESTTVLALAKAIWNKINPDKAFNYVSDKPYKQ